MQEHLTSVQHIQATRFAFAAILESGAVVTWGNPRAGGDSCQMQEQLRSVQQIQATDTAFAAILESGAVVTLSLEGVSQTDSIPPGRLLTLVRLGIQETTSSCEGFET